MRLEAIGKYFAPKSPMLSDSPRATASDSLDISGVMTALGLAESQCGIGIELYLAKIGVSSPDKAVTGLVDIAGRLAERCRPIADLDDDVKIRVLQILATFAYQDYSRSAASVRKCDCCKGTGFIEAEVFTNKVTFPWGRPPYWAKMSRAVGPGDWEKWNSVREEVRVKCSTCDGKGVISNACRCHGKGKVIDKEKTAAQGGVPVWRECERCSGRGYARLKFSTVVEGVRTAWDVKKTTAYDHIQPFFETLITECHKQEAYADSVLAKVTS